MSNPSYTETAGGSSPTPRLLDRQGTPDRAIKQRPTPPELSVVVPVHNEQGAVVEVLTSWIEQLDSLAIDYHVAVYDDGSTDSTGALLHQLATTSDRLEIIDQPNRGHGPTILRGYHRAAAPWILQVDSDGEISPVAFELFWDQRHQYDLLLGVRYYGNRPFARRATSRLARWLVKLAYGSRNDAAIPDDVNCPFRLMRRSKLSPLLSYLDASTFAPNVAIAGLFSIAGLRIFETPLTVQPRLAGHSSISLWQLAPICLTSAWQTILAGIRFRRDRR